MDSNNSHNIDRIKKRKCICGNPIKSYFFSCILMPFEQTAIQRVNISKELGSSFSFIPFGDTSLQSWNRLVFSHECSECGNISFWSLSKSEIDFLINADAGSNGYGIELVYNYEEIKLFEQKTNDNNLKKEFQNLLKLFNTK